MGRKQSEAPGTKRRPKSRPETGLPREPLMLAVEGHPPSARFAFEWVVGRGIGPDAVKQAQAAFERAFAARAEMAEKRARNPEGEHLAASAKLDPSPPVTLGPLSGVQAWEIEDTNGVTFATTWNWVGYVVVTDGHRP